MTDNSVSESRIEDMTDEQASDALAPKFLETPDWVPPVDVSGAAHKALTAKFRRWSGWDDASMVLDNPKNHVTDAPSEVGMVNSQTHTIYLNVDKLSLNPNRVLRTINPFRLRQEAIITGIMLHEAGHARHSHWRDEEVATGQRPVHGDGTPVTEQTMRLACLMEEPRVEGLMARDARELGAARLGWTMRAAAAHMMPMTTLSAQPGQQIMDLITSWALRAGRVMAYSGMTNTPHPQWVNTFTGLVEDQIESYLFNKYDADADTKAQDVMRLLINMALADETHNTDTLMVDHARDVLNILFDGADGDSEGAPMPGGGCAVDGHGEPHSEPGDESEDSDTESQVAQVLARLEQQSGQEMESSAKAESESPDSSDDQTPGGKAGGVGSGSEGFTYRNPTAPERQYQKDAEKFLRSLIAPRETSVVKITDSPAATVDAAAYEAWRAGGMKREPRFFKRLQRQVVPNPPVDVAVLTDISGSMDELQHAQAVLGWALSAATLDLSNFAGRGQQIRSCMIHWGDKAKVVQQVGQTLPGIREVPCREGTYALGPAMDLVEQEMPGFLDPPSDGKPTNRLLVMFTDWDHAGSGADHARRQVVKALNAGVNMVTITPRSFYPHRSLLNEVLAHAKGAPGISSLSQFDPNAPSMVWEEAAKALEAGRR